MADLSGSDTPAGTVGTYSSTTPPNFSVDGYHTLGEIDAAVSDLIYEGAGNPDGSGDRTITDDAPATGAYGTDTIAPGAPKDSLSAGGAGTGWYDFGAAFNDATNHLGHANDALDEQLKALKDAMSGEAADAFQKYGRDVWQKSTDFFHVLSGNGKDTSAAAAVDRVGHVIQAHATSWWWHYDDDHVRRQEYAKVFAQYLNSIADSGSPDSALIGALDGVSQAAVDADKTATDKLLGELKDVLRDWNKQYGDVAAALGPLPVVLSKDGSGGSIVDPDGTVYGSSSGSSSGGSSGDGSGSSSGDSSGSSSGDSSGSSSGSSSYEQGYQQGYTDATGQYSSGSTDHGSLFGSGSSGGSQGPGDGIGGASGGGSQGSGGGGDQGAADKAAQDAQKALDGLGSGGSGDTGSGSGSGGSKGSGSPGGASGSGGGDDGKAAQAAKDAEKALDGLAGGGSGDGSGGGSGQGSGGSGPGAAMSPAEKQTLGDAKKSTDKALDDLGKKGLKGSGKDAVKEAKDAVDKELDKLNPTHDPEKQKAIDRAKAAADAAIDKALDPAQNGGKQLTGQEAIDAAKKAADGAIDNLGDPTHDQTLGDADKSAQDAIEKALDPSQNGGRQLSGDQAAEAAEEASDKALDALNPDGDPSRGPAVDQAKAEADKAIDQALDPSKNGGQSLSGQQASQAASQAADDAIAGLQDHGGSDAKAPSMSDFLGGGQGEGKQGAALDVAPGGSASSPAGLTTAGLGAGPGGTPGASPGASPIGGSGMPMSPGMMGGGAGGLGQQGKEREPVTWLQATRNAWGDGDDGAEATDPVPPSVLGRN